jgi:hypothetical protein
LIREVISVAELYTSHSTVQDDDRVWFRAYPGNVIKRGKLWLAGAAHAHAGAESVDVTVCKTVLTCRAIERMIFPSQHDTQTGATK